MSTHGRGRRVSMVVPFSMRFLRACSHRPFYDLEDPHARIILKSDKKPDVKAKGNEFWSLAHLASN
ncbi:unnamed protein product [Dovyalis caffra]|uniref:Uncharacterized protein n=1 Tax=Dovyalis caffra TaxID=77055 RepID=A0AAV1REW2_9ROSI|nr:unnamed protein product [Dovyalis caffra]